MFCQRTRNNFPNDLSSSKNAAKFSENLQALVNQVQDINLNGKEDSVSFIHSQCVVVEAERARTSRNAKAKTTTQEKSLPLVGVQNRVSHQG